MALYGVPGLPTVFVIDREGRVVDAVAGNSKERFHAALAKAGIQLDSVESTTQ